MRVMVFLYLKFYFLLFYKEIRIFVYRNVKKYKIFRFIERKNRIELKVFYI